MKSMEMKMPKLGASDDSATIVEKHFDNSDYIEKDILIFTVETSKAIHEIYSEESGYYYTRFNSEDEVKVNQTLCTVEETCLSKEEFESKYRHSNLELRITKKASVLIEQYDINAQDLQKSFIKEKDVLDWLSFKDNKLSNRKFAESDIILIGAGGHARMCLDVAIEMGLTITGFVDDQPTELNNIEYFGKIHSLHTLRERPKEERPKLILGLGLLNNLNKRDKLYRDLSSKFTFINLIHPAAVIESSAQIAENTGVQIMAGAIIGTEAIIGANTIINAGVIVSHHSSIGPSTHLTPGCTLAGGVKVGQRVVIGMNSSIYLGVKISDDTIINNLSRIDDDI